MSKTLVIMAAGMGSRFGGLKQATPVDADGNFIMDYSIYDAKKAGFDKVVCVIRKEFLELFESTLSKRVKGIELVYAFQEKENIPVEFDVSKREKPWGTAQAVLCTKPFVDGDFVIINADDYYGTQAYKEAMSFFELHPEKKHYACISYEYAKSTTGNEAVKRGVLDLQGNQIFKICESSIKKEDNRIIATPLNGTESFLISESTPVSMNMFAFKHDVFDLLDAYMNRYFMQKEEDILKNEALLPDALSEQMELGSIIMYNQPSHSEWLGMTYREDLDFVKEQLRLKKEKGEYPEHLWL